MRLLGAILAGGQAKRFGSDKALALLDGRPLIAHAAATLHELVAQTVVCGRSAAPPGLIAIPDWPGPDLGPLGGLCAALRHAAGQRCDAVLSIGCDMPTLPPEVFAALIALPGAGFVRQAPIIGRWPVALTDQLARHLALGEDRSVFRWATSIGAGAIDAKCDIANFNNPGDLARYVNSARN